MRQAHIGGHNDDEVDLNPLIDLVTILIVFFMIGGRMNPPVAEQITVPPAKSGGTMCSDWEYMIANVSARNEAINVRVGNRMFSTSLADGPDGYREFRALLDKVYDRG